MRTITSPPALRPEIQPFGPPRCNLNGGKTTESPWPSPKSKGIRRVWNGDRRTWTPCTPIRALTFPIFTARKRKRETLVVPQGGTCRFSAAGVKDAPNCGRRRSRQVGSLHAVRRAVPIILAVAACSDSTASQRGTDNYPIREPGSKSSITRGVLPKRLRSSRATRQVSESALQPRGTLRQPPRGAVCEARQMDSSQPARARPASGAGQPSPRRRRPATRPIFSRSPLGFLEGGQNLSMFPTDQDAQGPAPIISVTAHSWTRRSVSSCSLPCLSRATKSNSDHSG